MPAEISPGLHVETLGDILDRRDNEMTSPAATGLAKLREPFPPHQVSKLPKPTKAQTDEVRADYKKGVRCKDCGSWHHPNVVHLDYVGHAALTDRLLDTDPEWSWEPMAVRDGLPAFDQTGGLWIRLTVCGVSRLGYGHAATKPNIDPGAREKEVIGDALRNAAMRFGAALDLWHKGDLHVTSDDDDTGPMGDANVKYKAIDAAQCAELRRLLKAADSSEEAFCEWLKVGTLPELAADGFARAKKALENRIAAMPKKTEQISIDEDDVPY